jgi:CxxC-x17-CxxC domain-containing protein
VLKIASYFDWLLWARLTPRFGEKPGFSDLVFIREAEDTQIVIHPASGSIALKRFGCIVHEPIRRRVRHRLGRFQNATRSIHQFELSLRRMQLGRPSSGAASQPPPDFRIVARIGMIQRPTVRFCGMLTRVVLPLLTFMPALLGMNPRRSKFRHITNGGRRVNFVDKSLTCADCGTSFTFSAGDQAFHQEKGFTNEPRRCPSCRAAKRSERSDGSSYAGGYGGQRVMYSVTCSQCGKEAQLPFQPTGDRPVYCSTCFSQRRNDSGGAPANYGGRGGYGGRASRY